ncbi:MAG: retroviral-like aspartic protease family protein [Vicinamibacteria bacterium]
MSFKPFARERIAVVNHRARKVVVSKEKVPIFVDSGASISILPERLRPFFETAGPFKEEKAVVQTANGLKEVVSLKDVTLCVENVCSRGNVLVSDSAPGTLLIGSDFLSRAKCKVDFEKKVMKCGGRKIKFVMEG